MKINEFYQEIGGDYTVVLGRMMGSEAFLSMLLQAFLTDRTHEQLVEAAGKGRAEDIFAQAHTLKGTAANLGLKPLYEHLEPLVELTRQGRTDGAEDALSEAEDAYGHVTELLKRVEFV